MITIKIVSLETNSPIKSKRKKFPAKQIYNVWLSLKKLNHNSLVRSIRNSPRFSRHKRSYVNRRDLTSLDKQFTFRDRLTISHPELSYHEGLAQLSNYQSFDDLNLITIHHNSENYISDNIEFHRNEQSLSKSQDDTFINDSNREEINCTDKNKSSDDVEDKQKLDHNLKQTPEKNAKLNSGHSTPTSFFSRFRSASPNLGSINRNESPKYSPIKDKLPSNLIFSNNSCSTFLSKRPHSSLNYNESLIKRNQFKQTETLSASDDDLLLDTISEQQSIKNLTINSNTPTKRRDSFLLKLLKKHKSIERNPLERISSSINYEYYNQSLDDDYENSISQNVSHFFSAFEIVLKFKKNFCMKNQISQTTF